MQTLINIAILYKQLCKQITSCTRSNVRPKYIRFLGKKITHEIMEQGPARLFVYSLLVCVLPKSHTGICSSLKHSIVCYDSVFLCFPHMSEDWFGGQYCSR